MSSPARRTAVAHPDNISAGEIVLHWLDANGFHGLYRPGACACTTAEISPFDCMGPDCEAGHFVDGDKSPSERIGGTGGKCGSCSMAGPRPPAPAVSCDHEMHMAAYYKAGTLQEAPPYVPAQVLVLKETFGDFPFRGAGVAPGVHDCECNRWGAVSVKARDGKLLGLRLHEFEPVSWRPNQSAANPERQHK